MADEFTECNGNVDTFAGHWLLMHGCRQVSKFVGGGGGGYIDQGGACRCLRSVPLPLQAPPMGSGIPERMLGTVAYCTRNINLKATGSRLWETCM